MLNFAWLFLVKLPFAKFNLALEKINHAKFNFTKHNLAKLNLAILNLAIHKLYKLY